MKRLVGLVVAVLTLASSGFAYDGPTPVTYDQTLSTIRVVFTSQGTILQAGRSHFTMTAYVPIIADSVGQSVQLQIRRWSPTSDVLVGSCAYVPTAADVGLTIPYTCDGFEIVPGVTTGGTAGLYPRVVRNSSNPATILDHNGQALRLTVPVGTDDAYEQNDTITAARDLGAMAAPVQYDDLVWLDADYFKFTAPAGSGSAEIRINFWQDAADLDIYIYDSNGIMIDASAGSSDEERVNLAVVEGQTYYIDVEAYDSAPAFYDLYVSVGPPDIITITSGPTGTPNPVASDGTVTLSVSAVDSVGHVLNYFWLANCPSLPNPGTFSNRFVPNPTWTAPTNATGATRSCSLKVEITDSAGVLTQASYIQAVTALPDSVSITAGPSGTPNPVSSGGTVALSLTASDTYSHSLSYAWTATCPGLPGSGSFSPSASVATPTWTAPVNQTSATEGCTIGVTASDGLGNSASGAYTQDVAVAPHTITITSGPTTSADPIPSEGSTALSLSAADSYGHALTYAWTATCPAPMGSGTFTPNAGDAATTWTAPKNISGSQQTCTIAVALSDGQGQTANGSTISHVDAAPHTLTITAGPTGTPEPVASASPVNLTVTAVDSYEHTLTYAWTAVCAGGLGAGSFDNAAAQTPTWTAPVNATGASHACTLSVVASDGLGQSDADAWVATVQSVADAVTITAGPTGTPEPVASAGAVALTVTAVDSILGHSVSYAWSAACAGGLATGTFDNAAVQTPTWTAPVNATGASQACTLTVLASDGLGQTATGTWISTVQSIPDVITITAAPLGTPEPVASSGAVALTVSATDSILGHTLTYAWSATCAGGLATGSFDNAAAQTPTWTAPVNATGAPQACTLLVTLTDGAGQTETAAWVATVQSIADVVTITAAATGTPEPVASAGAVALAVTATDSILGHTLTYAWTAVCAGGLGAGSFDNAAAQTPTWTAPVNATGTAHACTLSVVASDGLGQSDADAWVATVQSVADAVTITAGPTGTPEPVASAGLVALTVTAADSILGHSVSYAWSAACAGGLATGTFDNAAVQTPTWTAPVNATGASQACTLTVLASDGLGQTATGTWISTVQSIPDVITITAAPLGTPEPVASSGAVALTVSATDSILGHTLTYAWSATCAGGLATGSFDNAAAQTPTWTAPVNATGAPQACTLLVTLTDGAGQTETAAWVATVQSIADVVTITAAATGTPEPVASAGAVAVTVTATDSILGHTLTYAWTAVCAGGLGAGSFDNAAAQTPVWTAPVNATGSAHACTLSVVASDGLGQSDADAWVATVQSVADAVTITAGPTGTPEPVASAGAVALTVTAVDSILGHSVSYAWSAACAGGLATGTFDNAAVQTPTWTAPVNATGASQACTLSVVASDGLGQTATGTWISTVQSIPDVITITAAPLGTPEPVASSGAVALTVSATDSILGHTVTYAWSATCAGGLATGSFDNPAAQTPTWTAPVNATGAPQACTLLVTLTDGAGQTETAAWVATVQSIADVVAITAAATGTPEPVASAGAVTVTVTATDSILGHTLTYAWTAVCAGGLGAGSFDDATAQSPVWTAPVNATGASHACTLSVVASDGLGQSDSDAWVATVQSVADAVTITAGPTGTPEPVASAGLVALTVTAVDSILGHSVSYAWSAACAGGLATGTFDNAAAQTPTWTAPVNATGASQACTLSVVASDGLGQTATGTWISTVQSIPDVITITAAPLGTPEPVASSGAVALTVSATDSILGHTLTYAWSATCAGGLATGSFDNPAAQTPSWTAPVNATGAPQACTLLVTLTDGAGQTETAAWVATVQSIADVVTITAAATGTPEPVASAGAVAVTVTATDSILGHTLTYAWTAVCAGGLGAGSFDNAAAQTPTWTAPVNATGASHACTLSVVASDGLGQSDADAWVATVQSVADAVTITAGPTGTPEPVASAGAVALTVTAVDSILGHSVSYAWSAACAGGLATGTFDNAAVQTPMWTAPVNATGASQACTLSVVASDGLGQTATGTWISTVQSIPDVITITAAPLGTPEPVASSGAVALTVSATDSILGHTLTYAWSATCAGGLATGSFDNPAAQTPSWTAPVNATGAPQACTLLVTLTDGAGQTETAAWVATVQSIADVVTITAAATGTPEPVASAGAVAVTVTATDSILGHTLTYAWTAVCAGGLGAGSFDNAAAQTPTWTAPVNATGASHACTLSVVASDGLGQSDADAWVATVQSVADAVTITAGPTGTPEPVASAGLVALTVTAVDSILGHSVSYAWSAACAGGLATGTFDNAAVQTPMWTAPVNATGASQACTLTVLASDGLGQTATGTWISTVQSIPDVITITAAPLGTPEPVASSGAVALTVSATDSILGHTLTYAWSATCAGGLATGSFDNPAAQTPSWTAPVNATGAPQACTLLVTLTDGAGQTETAAWVATVQSIADVVAITAAATGTPEPVASAGAVTVTVTATDSILGHTLTYAWTAVCAGGLGAGSFDDATAQSPVWTAPVNATGASHACTLSVVASDGLGQSDSDAWVATVQSVADAVTITAGPTGTPEPVASAGAVALTVTAADSILGHSVSYAWSAACAGGLATGSFDNAAVQTPTWTAPVNATGASQACTLTVLASDGLGQTATGTWISTVQSIPDVITITAAPLGTPEPVASSGAVALTVSATDSILGHTLTYAWSATCAGGLATGSFDNPAAQTPSWTAPVNATGAPQACTLLVTLTDGAGQTETAAWVATVQSIADVVAITAAATGTPEPVASAGAVTVTVTATDSILGHTLTYAWTAVCAGGLGAGSFDDATAQSPVWTAPVNATGASHACTLSVVASDGLGQSDSDAWVATVQSVADAVTITAGPTGTPEPVASAGLVALTVTAVDSILGHSVSYAWSAACAGGLATGTFDNAAAQTPTWTAPVNATGASQACTLSVVASDGLGQTATGTWISTVQSIPDVITITAAPLGTPEPVASSGAVALTVSATDSILGHTVTYAWSATCAGGLATGSFDNAAGQTPTWTAPVNATGAPQACTLLVTLTDGAGQTETAAWVATVQSIADVVTITAAATGTPEPVASAGAVTVTVTATDSILGHTVSYSWSASCSGSLAAGSFAPNANVQNPTWTAPVNLTLAQQTCTLTVVASDGVGQSASDTWTAHVEAVPDTIVMTAGPTGTPNPVASGGAVALTVTAEDPYTHALTFGWSATCAGSIGSGAFSDAAAQSPTWTAPVNATGVQQTCTIALVITDGFGQTANATWIQQVDSVADVITITAGPTGTPDPVASAAVVTLSLTASDSIIGHTLTYAWTSACAGGLEAGSYSDTAASNPTWTAPANATGAEQTCTLSVAVSDGHGHTENASWSHRVSSVPDGVTITAGPAGTPDPVASSGAVTLSVTASDPIIGHALAYSWSATCGGGLGTGSFSDAGVQNPSWTAPVNLTLAQQTCTLSVLVSDGHGQTANGSWAQRVDAVPDAVSISAGPAATPDPVASQGIVSLTVTGDDPYAHALTYAWSATCVGLGGSGTFAPNAAAQNPTWTAPKNATGVQRSCTLSVAVSDEFDHSATAALTQHVNSVPDVITVTDAASGTPDPAASSGVVALSVSASDSILGHALAYSWSASCNGGLTSGTFSDASEQSPSWTAPANATGTAQACTFDVTITDGHGQTASSSWVVQVDSVPDTVSISAGPTGTPDPVASAGAVALAVSASDSIIGHTLTYAWSATCTGLSGNGSFSPDAAATAPTWTAPVNKTGSSRTCTISVTVSDSFSHSATSSVTLTVDTVPDAITITSPMTANPNPVVSGGTIDLSIGATDSLDHALTYAWSASCPGLSSNGTFDAPLSQTTKWTAPANLTASSQSCLLVATITDGFGQSLVSFVNQVVARLANHIEITAGPDGTPNPVESAGTVAFSVKATKTWGDLLYSWTANCPGSPDNGSFQNADTATPTWTAPVNSSSGDRVCIISVSVGDGAQSPQAASLTQIVKKGLVCTYTLTPIVTTLSSGGGTGSLDVQAPTGCDWTATTDASWLTIGGAPGGNGNGTVTFTSAASNDADSRSGMVAVAGQNVPVTQDGIGYRYYFAEGATINGFFETRFALLNTDAAGTAHVSMDFQLKDTTTVLTHEFDLGPKTRATVDVGTLGTVNPALAILASAEFSTVIRADRPLVADRTMTWNSTAYGSHAETAILAPAATWYLAEGATIGNFELYYLIQNPNPVPLDFTVTYLLPPPAAPVVRTYPIGANTRTNIAVHAEPGLEDVELSAVITAPAETPIIVERAMYLTTGGLFYGAGHESAGIRQPETQWFFAEGATGDFFDLFILIGNPNTATAHITATFLFDDGTTCSTSAAVDPKSRYNIWVDVTTIAGCPRSLADAAVSTTITSDLPVIAERTMWWPGPSAGNWAEAHNAAGASTTGTLWTLADGEQGGPRSTDTYILVANTSAYAGTARVTLYFEDGTTAQKDVPLSANSRSNVAIGLEFGTAVANRRFGSTIESLPVAGQAGPAQIVVERAMYANGPGAAVWAAGTDVLATRVR